MQMKWQLYLQGRWQAASIQTSLLPDFGKKMRCYGLLTAYTIGAGFALPECRGIETEEEVTRRTKTWS
jgi:hypothetical protein